jgi:outer membrane protein assembly factor BamB
MLRKTSVLISLAALVVAGCSEKEQVLPGERLNVRDVLSGTYVDETALVETAAPAQARAFRAPAVVANADWSQSPVSPHVRTLNSALGTNLSPLFSISRGRGRAQVTVERRPGYRGRADLYHGRETSGARHLCCRTGAVGKDTGAAAR